jgi:hypothetical protein
LDKQSTCLFCIAGSAFGKALITKAIVLTAPLLPGGYGLKAGVTDGSNGVGAAL